MMMTDLAALADRLDAAIKKSNVRGNAWLGGLTIEDALRIAVALRAQIPREPMLVGWMVGAKLENAAMYNISQREDAFDAAKRWGTCITGLVAHPDAPDLAQPEAQPSAGTTR